MAKGRGLHEGWCGEKDIVSVTSYVYGYVGEQTELVHVYAHLLHCTQAAHVDHVHFAAH